MDPVFILADLIHAIYYTQVQKILSYINIHVLFKLKESK